MRYMSLCLLGLFLLAGAKEAEASPFNCGAVGYTCLNGRDCVGGVCVPAWQDISVANAPSPRGFAAAGTVGGSYVVSGGCDESGALASTAAYDPATDTWSSLPALSSPRAQHSAVSNGHGTFVYGGINTCWNGTAIGPGLEQLAALNQSWTVAAFQGEPSPRYNVAVASDADRIYVYAGSDATQPALSSGGVLDLSLDPPSWTDISCPLPSCERGGAFQAFVDGGTLRVWGGSPSFGDAPNVLQFTTDSLVWSPWTAPPGTGDFNAIAPSSGSGLLRYGDDGRRIYYLSNLGGNVEIYDRQAATWTEDATPLPDGLCTDAATAWVGGELIAWGGACGGTYSAVGARYQPPAP